MNITRILLLASALLPVVPAGAAVDIPAPGAEAPTAIYNPATLTANELAAFRKEAAAGGAQAQYLLGVFYAHGAEQAGLAADEVQAVSCYRKAAANGHGPALYELALRHLHGAGVEKNAEQAKALLRQAAQKRNLPAQLLLARICMDGEEPDFREAAKWLRQYRGLNADAQSAYLLARCCLQQFEDIGATEEEGHRLMAEAAMGDWPAAQFTIGLEYECGFHGEPDTRAAAEWYRKAAEGGHAEAMGKLAHFYETGDGVELDLHQAFHWYEKAAQSGNAEAAEKSAELRRMHH